MGSVKLGAGVGPFHSASQNNLTRNWPPKNKSSIEVFVGVGVRVGLGMTEMMRLSK